MQLRSSVQVLLLYLQKFTGVWEVFLKDNRAPSLSNLGPQLWCVFWVGLRYCSIGFRVVVAVTFDINLVAIAVNASVDVSLNVSVALNVSVDVASVRIASCEFARNLVAACVGDEKQSETDRKKGGRRVYIHWDWHFSACVAMRACYYLL